MRLSRNDRERRIAPRRRRRWRRLGRDRRVELFVQYRVQSHDGGSVSAKVSFCQVLIRLNRDSCENPILALGRMIAEPFKEFIDRFAALDVIQQGLDRYTRARKESWRLAESWCVVRGSWLVVRGS